MSRCRQRKTVVSKLHIVVWGVVASSSKSSALSELSSLRLVSHRAARQGSVLFTVLVCSQSPLQPIGQEVGKEASYTVRVRFGGGKRGLYEAGRDIRSFRVPCQRLKGFENESWNA